MVGAQCHILASRRGEPPQKTRLRPEFGTRFRREVSLFLNLPDISLKHIVEYTDSMPPCTLHVRLICAIKHLLTYLLMPKTARSTDRQTPGIYRAMYMYAYASGGKKFVEVTNQPLTRARVQLQ